MRLSLTRLSLIALVLLAALAVLMATLVSRGPARPAGARAPAAAAPGGRIVTTPASAGRVSLLTPDRAAPGTVVLTAYSAASRVAAAQSVARTQVRHRHWATRQYRCLVRLWNRESGWNVYASNPSSGAYGIPQAVPGSKMASAGRDWRTSARTQIRWGLSYIKARYGSPCGAWAHSNAYGWY